MQTRSSRIVTAALGLTLAWSPLTAFAHNGGPLDEDGCHADHRSGTYHCHRGPAAGCSFPTREAMLEAVSNDHLPEKTVDKEGWLSRLWPFGKRHDEEPGPGDAKAGPAEQNVAEVSSRQSEYEQKLKRIQGLYEMGLLTKDEYEARRKALADQL